jgi:hypothetical protein
VKEILFDTEQRIRINKLNNLYLHGKELLYIRLSNGDRITRLIQSYSQSTGEEEYTEFIVSSLPEFDITEIRKCTLVYLGRLDQDSIDISFETDLFASCELSFVELLEEYDD